MSEFAGQVIIVTGSSSGIGEACAQRFAALGASVVVNSARSVDAGTALAASLPDAMYVQADIANIDDCQRLIDTAVEHYGRIDGLVNNAGWTTVVPHDNLDELTPDIFTKTFDVNVHGTWNLTKFAMPHLAKQDGAWVTTITSIAGVRPVGSSIAYSMSKAALNHMTKLLAKSHGPTRFNAVAPGLVATPWTADWEAQHQAVAAMAPVPRSATADDCAEAVLALARNRYTSGEIFVVDGGLTQCT